MAEWVGWAAGWAAESGRNGDLRGDTAVNDLNYGQNLTDSIDYTLTDGISTDTATLTITIQGHTDV